MATEWGWDKKRRNETQKRNKQPQKNTKKKKQTTKPRNNVPTRTIKKPKIKIQGLHQDALGGDIVNHQNIQTKCSRK